MAFLGIDQGIVNIAITSDGQIRAGRALNRGQLRERTMRTKLQKKNSPSAKRRLKKRRRKEALRAKDINQQDRETCGGRGWGHLPRP